MIRPEDIGITVWNPRGAGGQQVGTPTGLRFEYLPTGMVMCLDMGNRSQHATKEIGISMIEAAVTHPRFR